MIFLHRACISHNSLLATFAGWFALRGLVIVLQCHKTQLHFFVLKNVKTKTVLSSRAVQRQVAGWIWSTGLSGEYMLYHAYLFVTLMVSPETGKKNPGFFLISIDKNQGTGIF